MLNLKTVSIGLIGSLVAFGCLASDFDGSWRLSHEKDSAKALVSFDKESGMFKLNQFKNIQIKCDEINFSKKEMGILKNGQVSDTVLICKALDDNAPAVYSINYLNSEKTKAVFRNIEDGDDILPLEKSLLDLVNDGSKNGTLEKFTISGDGENAHCKKIKHTKSVDSNVWNMPITYFCDIEEDPDSSAIIGLKKDASEGQILLIQDLGDEDDHIIQKI